jgi:hypothetical protein
MHPVDRIAAHALGRAPARSRLFAGGWGDPAALDLLDGLDRLAPPVPLEPVWGPWERRREVRLRAGHFSSPLTALPEPARTGHVLLAMPDEATDRVCLLMPAWNDHGYASRLVLARHLARRGIGSLLLENPFYGGRRTAPTRMQAIRTVAEFALMGMGALEEGRGLITGLAGRHRMGVAGYSMGGNLAALVSATVTGPLATVPLAASHSPGPVYLDGVLRAGIDWQALAGPADPEAELRRRLSAVSALRIEPPDHVGLAVLVAARDDGFVPIDLTRALHRHWPGSELREVAGGHATLWYAGKPALARAVAAAFTRAYPP